MGAYVILGRGVESLSEMAVATAADGDAIEPHDAAEAASATCGRVARSGPGRASVCGRAAAVGARETTRRRGVTRGNTQTVTAA